jgi:hypothetical protein
VPALWPVIYAYIQQRSNCETPASGSELAKMLKVKKMEKELTVCCRVWNTQNWRFLDSYVFQIQRSSWFFDSDFFKYLEPASSWILILQTPRTGGSLKNQRTGVNTWLWIFFCTKKVMLSVLIFFMVHSFEPLDKFLLLQTFVL